MGVNTDQVTIGETIKAIRPPPTMEFVSNRNIKYENSIVLQEALGPHYIHQIGGK